MTTTTVVPDELPPSTVIPSPEEDLLELVADAGDVDLDSRDDIAEQEQLISEVESIQDNEINDVDLEVFEAIFETDEESSDQA